jgi:hypothetical protein
MLFTLEALNADHGDALLLHFGTPAKPKLAVIDGGPAGVFARSVLPRLTQLRAARAPGGGPLPVRLAMITHIDDDHIRGVLDLLNRMVEKVNDQEPPEWKIETLWFNSFDDILGNAAAELAAVVKPAAAAAAAGLPLPAAFPLLHPESALVAASVNQGRTLRDQAARLKIKLNADTGGKLVTAERTGGKKLDLKDGLKVTVLSPFRHRVEALRQEWDEQVKKLKKAKPGEAQAIAAEFLDGSVFNLSSIAVLAEAGGKSVLLTGDARGDDVLAGLKAAKRLKAGRCHVDVLKLPHHGSDRNVATAFFRQVTADHYVISANGKFGNPDPPTLTMLTAARGAAEYTIHLTNMPPPPHQAQAFFAHDRAANGRKYAVAVRAAGDVSLRIDLGDPLTV